VKRNGHGANGQNGIEASGGIHGENGCRLANAIASPYNKASACGSSVRFGAGVATPSSVMRA
jgi:hypothetical protein